MSTRLLATPAGFSSIAASSPHGAGTQGALPPTAFNPFTSCIVRPRDLVFEQGVLGVDLLRLSCQPEPTPSQQQQQQPAPPIVDKKRSALASHPIHALTASAPLSPPAVHQARLDPMWQAMSVAAREKRETSLTYTSWLHHSALYFNATPAIAKLYWQTFLAIHRSSYASASHSHQASSAGGGANSIPLPSIQLEIDLQEFMLFLFLQRFDGFRTAALRDAAAVAATSPSPATSPTSKDPSLDLPRAFLLSNLAELLVLCRDFDRSCPDAQTSLTEREFNRLGLVCQGLVYPTDEREVKRLSDLTPFYTSTARTPSNQNLAISFNTLSAWMVAQLSRPALSVTLGSEHADSDHGMTSTGDKKPDSLPIVHTVDVKGVRDQSIFFRRPTSGEGVTVASPSKPSLSPSTAATSTRVIHPGSFVHLHHASHASFYLTMPSRFVSVKHVSHSLLHLGVVTHQVQLHGLSDCIVCLVTPSTPSGGLGTAVQVSQCRNVKIYAFTNGCLQILNPFPPAASDKIGGASSAFGGDTDSAMEIDVETTTTTLLAPLPVDPVAAAFTPSNCSALTLAPYNTFHPDLQDDLVTVGLKIAETRQAPATFAANSWNASTTVSPVRLPAMAPSGGSRAPSPITAGEPKSGVVAAGGRKGKTLGLLSQSTSVVLPPIYQTFPSLGLPSAAANAAGGGGASAKSLTPLSPSHTANGGASNPEITLMLPAHFFPSVFPVFPTSASSSSSSSSSSTVGPPERRFGAAPLTVRNPFPLPLAFSEALKSRQAQALSNRSLIDSARPSTAAQLHNLNGLIQAEFQAWMTMHYPKWVLDDMLRADHERIKSTREYQRQQMQQQQQQQQATATSLANRSRGPTSPMSTRSPLHLTQRRPLGFGAQGAITT